MSECIAHLTIRVLGFGGGPCVVVVEHTFNVLRYNVKKIMELVVEDLVLSKICSCIVREINILETNVFFSFSVLAESGGIFFWEFVIQGFEVQYSTFFNLLLSLFMWILIAFSFIYVFKSCVWLLVSFYDCSLGISNLNNMWTWWNQFCVCICCPLFVIIIAKVVKKRRRSVVEWCNPRRPWAFS